MAEDKKTEVKEEKNEGKEFVIPLRKKFTKTAKYKRVPKAIKAIKEYILRHMKVYDRDLKKVKLDKYLNEFVWTRGIKNPPSRIRVKAVMDGDNVRVEMAELPERLKFKKGKIERRESKAVETVKKKGPEAEKEKTGEEKAAEAEVKAEEKEKKAAVVEAGQKMEKAIAKQAKHKTKMAKQPKTQPRRMSLQK